MKKITSFLLTILMFSSTFAYSEGLLPSLTDAYGVDMPSMAVYLEREPDEETTDESGTVTQVFYQVSENDFDGFNKYLEENGCALADYSVNDNTVTETIEKQGKTFDFLFNSENLTAIFYYPAGSNPEKSPANELRYASIETEQSFIEKWDIVSFGSYEQDANLINGPEPIDWTVLEVLEDKALLISSNILAYSDGKATGEIWAESRMRNWLNTDFFQEAFMPKEQEHILKTTIPADINPRFNTNQGYSTDDKIFLLSIIDAERYFFSGEERICTPTEYSIQKNEEYRLNNRWWLRTAGKMQGSFSTVSQSGHIDYGGVTVDVNLGIRPAIWIKLEDLSLFQIKKTIKENNTSENVLFTIDALHVGQDDLSNINIGDNVLLGTYEQDNNEWNGKEPIEWLVLDKHGEQALIVSKYGLDVQPFNAEYKFVTWDRCSLRNWLKEDFFFNSFSSYEQKHILPTQIKPEHFTGVESVDYVFLLSKAEADLYLNAQKENLLQMTPYAYDRGPDGIVPNYYYNDPVCNLDEDTVMQADTVWWLRTPGEKQDKISCLHAWRDLDSYGTEVSLTCWCLVRPAMWISLE